ncbi:MAG: family 78 glycoside hydrolase catalytic domain [Planctomycetes bacterium]|nr:family 78 glycoside hydrolase catalytic domain [Planctomycetota bacterium]
MNHIARYSLLLAALISIFVSHSALAAIQPEHLRCEYRINPMGIDVTAPRLSWELKSESRAQKQSAYHLLVASSPEKLAADQGDLWDSGQVESDQTLHVEYAGKPLTSRTPCYWKVRVWNQEKTPSSWSEPASWSMGLLNKKDWKAQWIDDATNASQSPDNMLPASYLRKEFHAAKDVRRATVYVSGLGLYQIHLNGHNISDQILAPEITTYDKRIHYQTLDVTEQIRSGANAIGAILGDGWVRSTFFRAPAPSERVFQGQRGLIFQLEIELADGTKQIVVSDASWRGTNDGPIREQSFYGGEIYDARKEHIGWDQPEFDDSKWTAAHLANFSGANLVWQRNEPIRITRELQPVALTEPQPQTYVFDLGQNMVGWVQLKVRGPKGETVTLRHAEMLNEDGSVYMGNLRKATQTDQFIKGRDEQEIFEPHFTYHGFRYVEVTGLKQPPKIEDLVGKVFHSSSPEVSSFTCSDPFINQLMSNILWTQRANLMGMPTDCPQRDERAGWMGDIQAFSQTAIFNMDMAGFLDKFLQDVRDVQTAEGVYPDYAPHPAVPFLGAPAWADAGVILPWRCYTNYADRRLLEQHFESARRWVDYVHKHNPELLWKNKRGKDWGDWVNGDTLIHKDWPQKGGAIPKEILGTAFFANSARLVSKMARVIGQDEAADQYHQLWHNIRSAFQKAYVQPDGKINGETQAGYALALHFDLLPEDLRPKAAAHMVRGLDRYKGHMSTGIQTSHRLIRELSRFGYEAEAYRLLTLRSFPSWGFMIENGATTIWERWDGYVKGRGFQNPGMNSFNHWALGSVGEWVWKNIAGINPLEEHPGYKEFVVCPRPGAEITWAKGEYDSIRGRIVSDWRIDGDRFTLNTSTAGYHCDSVPAQQRSNGNNRKRKANRSGTWCAVGRCRGKQGRLSSRLRPIYFCDTLVAIAINEHRQPSEAFGRKQIGEPLISANTR